MQIHSGANWYTEKGNQRSFGATYDLDDLRHAKGDEAVDAMTNAERYKALSNAAERLVVVHLHEQNVITHDYAEKRLRELQ